MPSEPVVVVMQRPSNMLTEVNGNFLVSLNATFAIGKEPRKGSCKEIQLVCGAWLIFAWTAEIVDGLSPMLNEITTLFTLFPQI